MQVTDSYSPVCPMCGSELQTEGRVRLDCPGCGRTLVAAQSGIYRTFRFIGIYAAAAIWAWKRGWEPSFLIFVVSFYVFPVVHFWTPIESGFRRLFPPKRFEPAATYLQTLGI